MVRQKRSVSLPAELAVAIERAAAAEGSSVSAWLAETAAHRLKLESGQSAIAAWEAEHGTLSAEELADGLARSRALLAGASAPRRPARSA